MIYIDEKVFFSGAARYISRYDIARTMGFCGCEKRVGGKRFDIARTTRFCNQNKRRQIEGDKIICLP